MCPRAISEFGNIDMELDLFQKIIDDGASFLEFVYLVGMGEPLMNPNIFKMVRYCKAKGIRTGISTNATLLRGEKIEEVFASGLDYIILAFDGATPKVYEKYRKGALFETTKNYILKFLERKKELKSPITVTVQMVRLPDNKDQVSDFYQLWNIQGVDSIRIKEDEICIDGVCLDERKGTAPRRNPCHVLWQGPAYIEENGDFYPCCSMWRSEPFGNVREYPIAYIWNNNKMQAIRRAHVTGNLSAFPECISCKAARPRLPLIVGSFLVDIYRVRRIIPMVERISLLYKIPLFEDRKW